jgi:4,5-dihydroxyphthalate decarboxylase
LALAISLACQNSDRSRPILDGRVRIEGCEVTYVRIDPEEIFHRVFRDQEFDVAELSLCTHLIATARGESTYVGVPAFLSRHFRHSAIFVRTDRGIESPRHLAGRVIGVPDFQQTAGVWVRGMLADEYGVRPADVKWRSGGLEEPGRVERLPLTPPPHIDLQAIPQNATLSALLAQGEIDGIVSPRIPSCVERGAPNVGRLFPDYRAAEEAYYAKTKLFPIMHLVGVRRGLAERHPWLATSVFKAFLQAKAICMGELGMMNYLRVTSPWIVDDVERVKRLMGPDFWRYGVQENAREIAALVRYAVADGLIAREVEPRELFAPSTVSMFKI